MILDSPNATPIEAIDEIDVVDFAAVLKEVNSIDSKKNSFYAKWSEKDRYSTGKYASENGVAAAAKNFKSRFPALNKSTVHTFRKRLEQN